MNDFDTLILGGAVVEGSGVPRYRANVGVKDGRIARIGRLGNQGATTVLDATGLSARRARDVVHDAQRGDPDGADAADHGLQLGDVSAVDRPSPLVVPQGPPAHEEPATEAAAAKGEVETSKVRPGRISWARLLKRVFSHDIT